MMKHITFPCISKPTDNSGSRGVMLIHNEKELRDAVAYSSENGRSGGVIIEEFLQGNEVSVEVMVLNGKPTVLNVTDKLTTGAPHFVEMGHSQPSRLPAGSKVRAGRMQRVCSSGVNSGASGAGSGIP